MNDIFDFTVRSRRECADMSLPHQFRAYNLQVWQLCFIFTFNSIPNSRRNSNRNHARTFCHAKQSEINYCKNDVEQTNEGAITLYRCLFYHDPNVRTFKYIIKPKKSREKVKKKRFVCGLHHCVLCACVDQWCAGSLVRSSDVFSKKKKTKYLVFSLFWCECPAVGPIGGVTLALFHSQPYLKPIIVLWAGIP